MLGNNSKVRSFEHCGLCTYWGLKRLSYHGKYILQTPLKRPVLSSEKEVEK